MAGTIHKEPYLTLHRRIGQAANDETTLEVLVIEPTGEPMIRHPDGRTWVLTWGEIIAMAAEKFDEPEGSAEVADEEGDARRIAACVKACEGIDLYWLEGGTPGWLNNVREERGQYRRERDEARDQRNALLVAAEFFKGLIDGMTETQRAAGGLYSINGWEQHAAAIAEAKDGQP